MMLGVGLQGTLLGLRASLEGFPTVVTGVIMSAYFAGFVGGSLMTPLMVARVGHIRVFAALASTASIAVLVHGVVVVPWVWMLMRLLSGFCMAGLYIVAESWINDRATNESRGKLMSLYMVIALGSLGLGQFLLNVADPAGVLLFLLASALVSLAVVPISLTSGSAPSHDEPESMGIRTLWKVSPLGLVGVMAEGMAAAAFYGMGAVYAKDQGMDAFQVSMLMAVATFGGMALQWPVGHASDRHDRRTVIAVASVVGGLAAISAVFVSGTLQLVAVALLGGVEHHQLLLGLGDGAAGKDARADARAAGAVEHAAHHPAIVDGRRGVRHHDEASDPAIDGRLGTGGDVFLLLLPRLTGMDVNVKHGRHDHPPGA